MAGDDALPPWPEDEWGRWLRPRGLSSGPMWVRPAHAAERSPEIETVWRRRALDLLEGWILDEGEREFVHRLHSRLCRPSAHLDAASRWEQVTRELRSAFEHGRVVVQRPVERGGAPGTIPIAPPGGGRPPPGGTPTTRTWIAVHVVDEQTGRPMAREPYLIVAADGDRRSGVLDEDGRVRLEGLVAGECDIELPDLDGREWGKPGTPPTAGELLDLHPERSHVVVRGEHTAAIAHRAGFRSILTVWDHAANAGLRSRRPSPHVLAPRDEVIVPPRTRRIEVGATTMEHELVARVTPLSLAIRVLDPWRRPLAGVDAQFLGQPEEPTDGQGQIDRPLRPAERTGHARVAELGAQLAIGGLIPVEVGPGLRARLLNLGYLVGFAWTEVDDDELAFAIADFQADEGLSITYTADAATQARLVEVHGS